MAQKILCRLLGHRTHFAVALVATAIVVEILREQVLPISKEQDSSLKLIVKEKVFHPEGAVIVGRVGVCCRRAMKHKHNCDQSDCKRLKDCGVCMNWEIRLRSNWICAVVDDRCTAELIPVLLMRICHSSQDHGRIVFRLRVCTFHLCMDVAEL